MDGVDRMREVNWRVREGRYGVEVQFQDLLLLADAANLPAIIVSIATAGRIIFIAIGARMLAR
jgi:hypothetical protein